MNITWKTISKDIGYEVKQGHDDQENVYFYVPKSQYCTILTEDGRTGKGECPESALKNAK